MRLTELTSRLKPEGDIEKGLQILQTKCSDAFNNWLGVSQHCIWRGVGGVSSGLYGLSPVMIADSTTTPPRKSANTLNYYTLIMDNSSRWKKFPKRSQSFIGSTKFISAANYGQVYAVFPFNGTKIGVCPKHDIWPSFSEMFDYYNASLFLINKEIKELINCAKLLDKSVQFPDPDDNSLSDFRLALKLTGEIFKKHKITKMQGLREKIAVEKVNPYIGNSTPFAKHLIDSKLIFNPDAVINEYDSLLDPVKNGFKLLTPKTYKFTAGQNFEVWFSGKAVFVIPSVLKLFRERIKPNNL